MFNPEEWRDDTVNLTERVLTNKETSQPVFVKLPIYSDYWFANPAFCKEYNLKTYGDFLDWISNYLITSQVDSYFYYSLRSYFTLIEVSGDWVSGNCYEVTGIAPERERLGVTRETKLYSILRSSRHPRSSSDSPYHLVDLPPTSYKRVVSFDLSPRGWVIWRYVTYTEDDRSSSMSSIFTKINNYTFKPPLEFFPDYSMKSSELYFGLELELSTNLTPFEISYIVKEVEPKQQNFFYFKSDSSISGSKNFNIELVTYPCSPVFLRKNFRIFFKKLETLCARKNKTLEDVFDLSVVPSNGLHIHISDSSFFSETERNKFVSLWNLWDTASTDFIQNISKRVSPYQNNRYCQINPAFYDRTIPDRLRNKGQYYNTRHSVCHYSGPTVEVRVFQSIFDLNHILNTISLVEAIHQFNHESSYQVLKSNLRTSFESWLFKQGKFTRVKRIMKGEK